MSFKIWRPFIVWLKQQRIQTAKDFYKYTHWKLILRNDNKVLIVQKTIEVKEAYVLNENDNLYNAVNWNGQYDENDYRGIIAVLKPNGYLKVQFEESIEKMIDLPEDLCCLNDKEFYIRDCILNHSAYATCDGSNKDHLFGGYCVITDAGRTKSLRQTCKSNKWELNNI